MNRIVFVLLSVVAAAACDRSDSKPSVPAKTPSADEVLEAHVTATGKQALAKLETVRARLTMTIEKMGIKGRLEVVQKRPNLSYSRVEFEGMGVQEAGCDGTICWERSDAEGARLLTGAELDDKLRDAVLDSDLRWRELYQKVEVTGPAQFEGRPAWKLVFTPKVGSPETKYFDRETHLELGSEETESDEAGQRTTRLKVLSYGTYGPFKEIRSVVVTARGSNIRAELESLDLDPVLPADRFALPADVAALVAGAPAEK